MKKVCVPISLRQLVRESLALWGVAAEVDAEPASTPAVHIEPSVEPAFRWCVRWHEGEPGSAAERMRPCGSLVGVLAALRRALRVECGSPIRIAPQPPALAAQDDEAAAAPYAAIARADGRIPVSVLTGFLGSGKTTLLGRLLREPTMGRTAVIINELGEIPLDHDLIETSDERFVRLSTGCLCCHVRSDLVLTLTDLAARRRTGELPPFERVVIETSGLADPAPILHALMTDRSLAEAYALDGVIATLDAVTGLTSLERHPEAERQAAAADTIVLTKTDVPQAAAAALETRMRAMNAEARILTVVRGEIAPALLFASPRASPSSPAFLAHGEGRSGLSLTPDLTSPALFPLGERRPGLPDLAGREVGGEGKPSAGDHIAHPHTPDITTYCLVRDQPVHAATLALFVSALAENCGEDLLRTKGLVSVAESPGKPAVIHGVQHVYHAPEWLRRWPSADERTRMVFIGRRLRPAWLEALLDLLEAEVAAATAARGSAA